MKYIKAYLNKSIKTILNQKVKYCQIRKISVYLLCEKYKIG